MNSATTKNRRCKQEEELLPNNMSEHRLQDLHRNDRSYMKNHADRNNIWDKSQLGMCPGVLGTVDQLVIDNAKMDEVREKQSNLAVAFHDYQKAYDMVRHDWMLRVYRWMGVPEKVVNVIGKLMSGWKTRLEGTENGKTIKTE